jgi:hypothetical protein
MSKGFGSCIPQVDLRSAPFMGDKNTVLTNHDKSVLIGLLHNNPIFELRSIARLLEKDISHIKNIIEDNDITVIQANDLTRGRVELITVESLQSIVEAECNNDNPYAQKVFRDAATEGLEYKLNEAMSKGLNSFHFHGVLIEFEVIDGTPCISLASMSRLTGVSEEQIEKDIQSPEFQRYYRSIQD